MDELTPSLRMLIQDRAGHRCKYCLLHEDDSWEPHQPDHITALKHRGLTALVNLAWTCALCNRHKGSDLASIDIESGRIVRVFNPRVDNWSRHFRLDDGRIIPRTPIGRVTEFLLKFHRTDRVRVRRILAERGLYPR